MRALLFILLIITNCQALTSQVTKHQLQTDVGELTLIRTAGSNDVIYFEEVLWNRMMSGTKFISANLPVNVPVFAYIEIADRRKGFCRSGIGFSCSIFPGSYIPFRNPSFIHAGNRTCYTSFKKLISGKISLVFYDKVDWLSMHK